MGGNIWKRTLVALFASPILVALILALWSEAIIVVNGGAFANFLENWALFSAILFCISATIGLAIHALSFRLGWRSVVPYGLSAIIVGALMTLPVMHELMEACCSMDWGDAAWEKTTKLEIMVFGGFVGGMTATLFWFIRRPDRDPPLQNNEMADHAA